MPKPIQTTYPKHNKWRFIQRALTDEELKDFARSIVDFDGYKIDECLPGLLRFLSPPTNDIGVLKQEFWLKIWVNIMHQMGLGYTSGTEKGNDTYLHATDLGRFVASTGNIRAYYYYWALNFQYPFGYPKHKHYVDNGVAVQPVVMILQYLLELYDRNRDINESFLNKYEIAQFLMKSRGHSSKLINKNCSTIFDNRASGYQYENEKKNYGFKEAADHLFSRGILFIKKFDLIAFENDLIRMPDLDSIQKAKIWLSYRSPPMIFKYNERDIRNEFFLQYYSNFKIDPEILVENVDKGIGLGSEQSIGIKERKIGSERTAAISGRAERPVVNPFDTTGTFSSRLGRQRIFQARLREDILKMYNGKCCICGMDIPEFLISAHVIPVGIDRSIANDRRNCLLLCALHDRAFENGYLSIKDDYSIIVNPKYSGTLTHSILKREILDKDGEIITLPSNMNLQPKAEYLKRHRHLHDISDNI